MTSTSDPPEAGIVVRPEQRVDGRALRVCMFVYNNCATDARVLKEATSLTGAGHQVQIVAVLDKRTVELEERDGFRIVRIDRQPPHYALLRRTRLLRRRLRRRSTVIHRGWGSRRVRLVRAVRRLSAPVMSALPSPRHRPVVVDERPIPVVAAPFVAVWRAVRWRVLRRVPVLRRTYYRRRAERVRRRRVQAVVVDTRGASSSPEGPGHARGRAAVEVRGPTQHMRPASSRGEPARAVSRGLDWTGRHVSHASYRSVMAFHKPLLYADFYRRAYAVATGEHFDVYHAHDLNTLPVAAAAARAANRPLIYDSHELFPDVSGLSRKERAIWRRIEPPLIRRASRVITVCESIASELVERYGVAKPEVLLNCPPASAVPHDTLANPLRAQAGLEDSHEPVVLYQGGYASGRGIDALIEAAGYLERGIVVLMGWGVIEQELAAQIRERGLSGKVRMIPPATREELPEYTAGADVGVIPYQPIGLNNFYTTPNKLFEYIAAGLPVAGSAVPEIRRFVEGYDLGLTFDPYDACDIAQTINRLLSDPALLLQKRANAKAAAAVLNWEREQSKLLRIYEEFGALAVSARRS